MPQRKRKPTSPGRRFQTVADFSDITKTRPERSLTEKKTSTGGRNNYGRMTSFFLNFQLLLKFHLILLQNLR